MKVSCHATRQEPTPVQEPETNEGQLDQVFETGSRTSGKQQSAKNNFSLNISPGKSE
jgi:hypothetical protein